MAVSKSNRKILIFSTLILIILFTYVMLRDVSEPISLKQFTEMYDAGKIKKAIQNDDVVFLYSENERFKISASELEKANIEGLAIDANAGSSIFFEIFLVFIALLLIGIILYVFNKERNNQSSVSRAPTGNDDSSSVVATTSDVLFRDVAGIEDVKEELFEIISFLKDPGKFSNFGVRMPRGLLLVGPPGVGKTMIAKAVAGEAGVPFYYQSASSFVQIYVGMGAKRVRELFLEAKRNAPSIIFIDEIDAVGKMRGASGRNDERDATLNQLLTEMDGFDSSSGVIVVAATNKIDVLDDALLRAGRFDRRIFVELPTLKERQAIIEKYLEKIPNNIDTLEVAKLSVGFNGASLATLINEAALKAMRDDKIIVGMSEIEAVKQKVKEGKKRLVVLRTEEKLQQANYHTAKAVVALFEKFPFEKCTMIGEDISIERSSQASKKALESEMKFYLAGLSMMQIQFGEHFANAEKDLSRAKRLASDMVKRFGMGSALIGDIEDEKTILQNSQKDVIVFLKKHRAAIEHLAVSLQQNEVLSYEEIKEEFSDIL
ncbi:MAG: AAA family ATPase [Thiovulaceae bacterium]|nr:AAA family ATPase [Sulfurimonadaceae bacterium]